MADLVAHLRNVTKDFDGVALKFPIIVTNDADQERIDEGATFHKIYTPEALGQYLIPGFPEEEAIPLGIVAGQFSDCWIRYRAKPTAQDIKEWSRGILGLEDCAILGPGQHPGSDSYWITPRVPIYVRIYEGYAL